MPLLSIRTNTTMNNEQAEQLAQAASKLAADMLGKPESYVMTLIQPGQQLLFAGSAEPAAHLELKSLGLPEDQTREYSATLCSFVEQQLKIPAARTYIEFSNGQRHMWGWNNSTFG